MKEIPEQIGYVRTVFEEFEKKNEASHALLLAHILRDECNSNSSDSLAETLGLSSLFMGMISLFVVAVLEGILSPLLVKYFIILLFGGILFIFFINFKYYLKNRKQAKKISSLIEEITSNYRNVD